MPDLPANSIPRPRHHSCEPHKNKIHPTGYLTVKPDEVLTRLRRAKETGLDPQLIIADLREARLFQAGHVLTARSASCYTKTMARRAVASWDCSFADDLGCPAPANNCQTSFCTQISQVVRPSVVVYDQRGDVLPAKMPDESPVRYFIDALIHRGNTVYFMVGGFEAFKALRSSAYIDRGPPISITVSSVEDVARPFSANDKATLTAPPPTLPPLVLLECITGLRSSSCDPLGPIHCTKTSIQPLCSSPSQPTLSSTSATPFSSGYDLPSLNVRDMLAARTKRRNIDVGASSQQSFREEQDDVMNASISKILPYLYLGNARDAQNLELLRRVGITHIINVTESVPMLFKRSVQFKYLHLPASDTISQDLRPAFDRAVQFIDEARKRNGIVLVHCQAGVSRSVAIVMAYLIHSTKSYTVLNALEFVQNQRPVAGPNLHFMGQLQRYYNEVHNRNFISSPASVTTAPQLSPAPPSVASPTSTSSSTPAPFTSHHGLQTVTTVVDAVFSTLDFDYAK